VRIVAISVSVCLFVCLSARISQKSQSIFHQLFCACYLSPWLGPSLTVMPPVTYFRFCWWMNVMCSLITVRSRPAKRAVNVTFYMNFSINYFYSLTSSQWAMVWHLATKCANACVCACGRRVVVTCRIWRTWRVMFTMRTTARDTYNSRLFTRRKNASQSSNRLIYLSVLFTCHRLST